MKDHKGVVLYVGKASKLPDRVSSYFVPSADLGPKKQRMLDEVHSFDTLVCSGEWEALLTENRLIKDIKPHYNARLVDDKSFPYLVVTQREDYPRVFVTRNPTGVDPKTGEQAPEMKGAKVIGPFTNAGDLREAVQILQRVFKFRTCKLDIVEGDPKNKRFRPCLLASIGQCTAPCNESISVTAYGRDIDRFTKFLGTKRAAMLREMNRRWRTRRRPSTSRRPPRSATRSGRSNASTSGRTEGRLAARDRDRLPQPRGGPKVAREDARPRRAPSAASRASTSPTCRAARPWAPRSASSTGDRSRTSTDATGSRASRTCPAQRRNDDYMSIREVVSRRYRDAGAGDELYPDVILIDGGLGQLHAALEAFDQLGHVQPPMVISLAKKEELIYVQRERAGPPEPQQRGAPPVPAGARRGAPVRAVVPPRAAAEEDGRGVRCPRRRPPMGC
jgi:excinuclease ABC subunit C